ncbi:MAG: NAD-dependent epimerase/dehydratase family protein [Promethearchaeota archaeon]
MRRTIQICITGATGQVGSHVVEYLLRQTEILISAPSDIICLVRNPSKADFLQKLGVTIIKGNLDNSDLLHQIFKEYSIEFVFHLAALVSVYASYDEMYRTNVVGTRNILETFCSSPAKCFIHTSSIIVYDHENARNPHHHYKFTEDSPLGSNVQEKDVPYAVTKRLAEEVVKEYANRHPTKSILITRLGPIIGKGDRQIIPSLVKTLALPIPKLVNHGVGQICLTAPLDVARAQVFLVKNGAKYSGHVFNVARESWNYSKLFDVVAEYYARPPPSSSLPLWLYKILKPLLKLIKKIFTRSNLIQTLFSESALKYLEYSYGYHSEKITQLGFSYQVPIRDSILEGLQDLDPDRRMVKNGEKW